MKNESNKNHQNGISLWQLEKMRAIIKERWSEVWKIVKARDRRQKSWID